MSQMMMKMVCSRFKSHFTRTGRCEKEQVDCLVDKSRSVNEEYMETFRTKSYIDMLSKVQSQLGGRRRSLDRLAASSSSLPFLANLSDYLLEPPQETLIAIIGGSNLHHLLIDYFVATFELCNTCELLLGSVHQARANYRIIQRVIKKTRESTDYTDSQCHAILKDLTSFAMLNNPLLISSPAQFQDIQDSHGWLLHRLKLKSRKVRRRAKFARYFKKTIGYGLVVSYSAFVSALLVLVVHSMVGIVAAPILIACSLGLGKKGRKLIKRRFKMSSLERLCAQLEVAEKVVYIAIKDFDTMSRLVRRLQDEIEHNKTIAEMCVRSGKREVVKEVVREFQIDQRCFLEQLEELEKHIYLCFLNMNRSRMLVIQQIMVQPQEYG